MCILLPSVLATLLNLFVQGPQLEYHLSLLKLERQAEQFEEDSLAPVFTSHVFSRCCDRSLSKPVREISQYGLLAGITKVNGSDSEVLNDQSTWEKDPRLFFSMFPPLLVPLYVVLKGQGKVIPCHVFWKVA